MAKITRQTMSVFGINAGATTIGVFGSLAAGSPTYSNVISTIQSLAAWGSGWAAETIATNRPALEDMNGLCYVLSYGICYLHQMGIAEYDAGTTYYINSICQYGGALYTSLIDSNINHLPSTSPTQWGTIGSSKRSILWYIDGTVATGDGQSATIRAPFTGTIVRADAYVAGAPAGANIVVAIRKNGSTDIWSESPDHRLNITAGGYSANTATFDVVSVTEGDYFNLDIDQVGSSAPGSQLTVELTIQGS